MQFVGRSAQRACISLIWLLVSSFHVPAYSATIERYVDLLMGCEIILSGPIVEGDAERLQALIDEVLRTTSPEKRKETAYRLCLNSPGGSFVEAVQLVQLIQGEFDLGTAIAEGHSCESACAVVFMAGGVVSSMFMEIPLEFVRPVMHPRAKLGFHAPSIEISEGQYSEAQVSQAWDIALFVVSQIIQMQKPTPEGVVKFFLNSELLIKMLSTPASSMFYIETVESAHEYDINIYPVGVNSQSPFEAFWNGCNEDFYVSGGEQQPNILRWLSSTKIEAQYVRGFGIEAAGSCRITVDMRDRSILIGCPEYCKRVPPYMTFAQQTRLEHLPFDLERSWREFNANIQATTLGTSVSPANNVTSPSYSSYWDHNGSQMGLVAVGTMRMLYYARPRAALAERGVASGQLLFEGERSGNLYAGTARIFATPPCGEFTYRVEGPVSADQRTVTMYGRAPRVNGGCEITGFRDDTLVFTLE